MMLLWEQEFGALPEPIDDIINRCRSYVIEASPDLIVIDEYVQIARAAQARGQPSRGRLQWGDEHSHRRPRADRARPALRCCGHLE
jgi:hypothetical protein